MEKLTQYVGSNGYGHAGGEGGGGEREKHASLRSHCHWPIFEKVEQVT